MWQSPPLVDRQSSFYRTPAGQSKVSHGSCGSPPNFAHSELRTTHAPTGDLRALERAFNVLARPGCGACYDAALLKIQHRLALFPMVDLFPASRR